MAKQCELCDLPARMFCESDQASLCWECDAKVHGANFLVARHCRLLLCRSCQAPTPWRASGSHLGSTVSVCSKCLGDNTAEGRDCCETARGVGGGGGGGGEAGERVRRGESMERLTEGSRDTEVEEEDSEDEDEDEDDEEYEEEAEDGDNQVVPWSTEAEATATASPPPAASCSSNDDSSPSRAAFYYGLMKRRREEDDLLSHHWQGDTGCSSLQHGYLRFSAASATATSYPGRTPEDEDNDEEATYLGYLREVRLRHEPAGRSTPPPSHRPIWRGLSDR